ncbi:MAG: transcription elongation factor GreA [Patescibacteria group bacterium]|nr:transcription elongation factor GreA [Patescibacteria group bacterium]MBU0879423.1 transcription elongation factor GreA [Patescibacteria group bacterium]MBU1783357.1 transcription elongation factor GreA [Patescibacteria group bacterium]
MSDQIISQEGYDKLKKELEECTTSKRQEIARRIESAKELGDLSENAEYSDAKEEQAFNEGRIAELSALLKNLTIVKHHGDKNIISLGSKIKVVSDNKERNFIIVSFNEANPSEGKISNESPLGTAFLGRSKGDKILVNTPRGEIKYEIVSIE